MIEIPRGSSPLPAAAGATPVASAAEQAAAQVAEQVDALVVTVQARQAAGPPAWEMLLKLNPAGTPAANAPSQPLDQITPETLRQLQQGQAVLVRTLARFPLPETALLRVNVSAQGIAIPPHTSPLLPATARLPALIKPWVALQQSPSPLLTNLLHLQQSAALTRLPEPVQAALRHLLHSLPDPHHLSEPGQMKTLVANSGLHLEAKLARLAATTPATENAASTPPTAQPSPPSPPTATLAGLARALRDSLHRLYPEKTASDTPPDAARPRLAPAALESALGSDLKLALQKLEKALHQAQPGGPAPTPAREAAATTTPASPTPSPAADASTEPAESPEQQLNRLFSRRESALASTTAERPPVHRALQQYAEAGRAETHAPPPRLPADLLLPPLPGQVLVQPHPRSHPSLKGDEMADAIVNLLLRQVRGTLARITLHQISSAASKQDTATPPPLSFDIPFLHAGQVDVFQFRIEEERTPAQESGRDNTPGKRWIVQLGFDIEGLGPLFCQLNMAGLSLSVSFWAAWENTLTHTKAHFDFLEQTLNQMGIRVEQLQGHLGLPEHAHTGVRNQLVDIKT